MMPIHKFFSPANFVHLYLWFDFGNRWILPLSTRARKEIITRISESPNIISTFPRLRRNYASILSHCPAHSSTLAHNNLFPLDDAGDHGISLSAPCSTSYLRRSLDFDVHYFLFCPCFFNAGTHQNKRLRIEILEHARDLQQTLWSNRPTKAKWNITRETIWFVRFFRYNTDVFR